MKKASDFFTPEERKKINEAVREAEQHTSGEIVPVVATSSGLYHRGEDVGGLLVGLAALAASWIWFQRILPVQGDWAQGHRVRLELGWLLLIIVAGFIAGVGVASRVAWLRRLLATHAEMRREVERSAGEAYGKFRVARSSGGTGVVLYVSLFERMVCVLGDEAIGAKLDQEIWNQIHGTIAEGIRNGRPAEALCQAIARCGELLGQHFPQHANVSASLNNELQVLD
jgi:putative membrane protein